MTTGLIDIAQRSHLRISPARAEQRWSDVLAATTVANEAAANAVRAASLAERPLSRHRAVLGGARWEVHDLVRAGLCSVPARLASVILELVEQDSIATGDGTYRIRTRYTHEDLATMIGAKRVAVSRAMKGLRDAGAVEAGRRSIVVRDAEALRKIADEAA